jgi:hypothetical protein
LKILEAQDYPSIELLVSDNGMNGTRVRDAVEANYSRPFTFRQNSSIVKAPEHFNQIVHQAAGEYFVILCNDDEITPNFGSELVGLLDRHPQASIAFGGQEFFCEDGVVIGKSKDALPEMLSGQEFIMATWKRYEYGFQSVSTFLARTERMRATGGYPDFFQGAHIDNALVVKLCLNSHVVFSPRCTFRNRVQESSFGWSVAVHGFATACKQFMRFLDDDLTVREFAAAHPSEWRTLKRVLREMSWGVYFQRWLNIYKGRLTFFQWTRAAFSMPFIPAYYRQVAAVFFHAARAQLKKIISMFRVAGSA